MKALVFGAGGQVGRALLETAPQGCELHAFDRASCDIAEPGAAEHLILDTRPDLVINAAAYTAVDAAETPEGRESAWNVNVTSVARLARIAVENDLTLVHVSSDYVFDGAKSSAYTEDDVMCPLGVYGQTKAAGDAVVSVVPRHYIVRTSWVIGDGNNFVRTMATLAGRGIEPSVVNDQIGRLSFTQDVAAGIKHLLSTGAEYGTYNLTNDGEPMSWADIAAVVYELCGASGDAVTGVTTEEYFMGKAAAPRPLNSILDLSRIRSAGFSPADQLQRLRALPPVSSAVR